ncbi:hypothetical protein D3C73_1040370 [compost metagenome]
MPAPHVQQFLLGARQRFRPRKQISRRRRNDLGGVHHPLVRHRHLALRHHLPGMERRAIGVAGAPALRSGRHPTDITHVRRTVRDLGLGRVKRRHTREQRRGVAQYRPQVLAGVVDVVFRDRIPHPARHLFFTRRVGRTLQRLHVGVHDFVQHAVRHVV